MILDTAKYLGPCECGRDHELRTKLVVCEHGALKSFDKYMADCGLTGFRTVIYDTNTYNLPGMTHVPADQEIVLEAAGLHSEKGLIEDCMTRFVQKPDYVVVVGGGTLMDFFCPSMMMEQMSAVKPSEETMVGMATKGMPSFQAL